jgi:hypothetical protein
VVLREAGSQVLYTEEHQIYMVPQGPPFPTSVDTLKFAWDR